MQQEIWVPVFEYEDRYEISNRGRLKSLDMTFNGGIKGQLIRKKGIIKKPIQMPNGYIGAVLWRDLKTKQTSIHRLVAIAFIPNPDNKPQVNHINGVKNDNRIENLEWATPSENSQHAVDNHLSPSRKGIPKPHQQKQIVQLDLDGNFIAEYPSLDIASTATGIPASNITVCAKGRIKRTRNCKWEYRQSLSEPNKK